MFDERNEECRRKDADAPASRVAVIGVWVRGCTEEKASAEESEEGAGGI